MIPADNLNTPRRPTRRANSTTPESKVLADVLRWCDERPDVYPVRVVQAGESGVPDLLLCMKGIFVGVECKASGKKPRPLQLRHGQRITQADGIFLWGSSAELLPELNELYDGLD